MPAALPLPLWHFGTQLVRLLPCGTIQSGSHGPEEVLLVQVACAKHRG